MSVLTNIYTFIIVVAISSVLSLSAQAQEQQSIQPVQLIHYLSSAKPIHLDRERISTFTIKSDAALPEEEALRLAEKLFSYTKLKMEKLAKPAGKIGNRIFFRDEHDASASLMIDPNTQGVSFNRGMAPYKGDGDTKALPGAEKAPQLALKHLEALGIIPSPKELVLAHVGGLNAGIHNEDGTTNLYRKLVVVRYDRKLGGLPVFGNSRIVVRLGEEGALVGLVKRWLAVEEKRVSQAELLADDAITESVKKILITEGQAASSIVVKKTDLVLYDHGGGVIEPAIHVVANMHYQVKVANGKIVGETRRMDVPYNTFVPVLKNPKGVYPFMHDPEAAKHIKADLPIPFKEREDPYSEADKK